MFSRKWGGLGESVRMGSVCDMGTTGGTGEEGILLVGRGTPVMGQNVDWVLD